MQQSVGSLFTLLPSQHRRRAWRLYCIFPPSSIRSNFHRAREAAHGIFSMDLGRNNIIQTPRTEHQNSRASC